LELLDSAPVRHRSLEPEKWKVTLASDQNLDPSGLSARSRRMLALRERVFEEWERRVRKSVVHAAPLTHPILIDTLPALYDNIAEALSPDYPRTSAAVTVPTVASEHGGERARLTNYNIDAIISEYQILRATIVDVLATDGLHLSRDDLLVISAAIDTTVREAATSFALAQAAFREQFVSALAHDLRTPLATASMAADLLAHTQDLAHIRQLAERIGTSLRRIDRMLQELLDTVVFRAGGRLHLDLSRFDMLELVREVTEQSAAVHGQRFEVIGRNVVGWWGRDTIKRALENLIGNAVKYGRPGTPIRVSVSSAHGRVLLAVHNEGTPIPADQLESIFQVFRRAGAAKGGKEPGWGIGLPYVRSVAESHGGNISVDSSAERGTVFTISMPQDARPFQNAPTLEKAR